MPKFKLVRNIGSEKDSTTTTIGNGGSGGSLTLDLGSPVVVGSHAGYDLIYYELPNGGGIAMDVVILYIGDGGSTWYPIDQKRA